MAVFKCKMCGGALEIGENQFIATCEYCGTQQTLPKLDNEKKLALFSRANNLRIKSEFDKAAGIYESIIAEFRDEAEAYWGLVLCKYGIEYVDDGKGSRIPTCHRTLPVAIMEDDDFQQACEYADITAKNIYRDEAKAIDKIQKKILNIALNEEPYDIFICYKETDDITGSRTEDSLIAQDIYTGLLKDGYRVFFSRVSLREVAGTEYEPYIYAALSSAKIMLAIGTKHDYYDAVWVKNEWSRFISMMSDDSSKVLIPCFREMDAYDMPKEFKNMQALDMGDVTFFGSLTENIERIIDKTRGKATKETIVLNNDNVDVAPLLERGFLFLEDKDWDRADEFFEAVLNKDPKNAQAYLGKLLVDLNVSGFEDLRDFRTTFSDNNNYEKIMRFADNDLKESVKNCNDIIARRLEEARKKDLYEKALEIMESATTEQMFENAGYMFIEVKDYADAKEKAEECFEKGEIARKDAILSEAKRFMEYDNISCYSNAIALFETIPGWRDADEQCLACKKRIAEIKAKEEVDRVLWEQAAELERLECERKEEEARKADEQAKREAEAKAKKNKKLAMIITPTVAVVLVFVIILTTIIIPNAKYNHAVALLDSGCIDDAYRALVDVGDYKDATEKLSPIAYSLGIDCFNKGEGFKAMGYFIKARGYEDAEKYLINRNATAISAGSGHTVGLKSDGTVVAVGYNKYGQCDVSEWTDIVAVSAGTFHTVGLKSDGTVVAKVYKEDKLIKYFGQCDVSEWTDIVAVSAGMWHTVGLKSDGTVVAVGDNNDGQCNVEDWTDIVAISASNFHTVGLKSDGTVVAVGDNPDGQCDVSEWTDIIAISSVNWHTVGLKSDGTVVAVGYNKDGRCDVEKWTDITAISAGHVHTIGLKSDGTVIAVGGNSDGQCDVSGWTDIVVVSAGGSHSVGLKSDGTVVAVGDNSDGECDVSEWIDIKLPNTNK